MIPEIRSGVIDFLKEQGLQVNEFGSKDLINKVLNVHRPACNVIVNRSRAEKVTASMVKTRYKYILTVSIITVFEWVPSDPVGEARRREESERLLEALGDSLVGQSFGLQLENPLLPMGFRNITTKQYQDAGYMLFQTDFWCSYIIEKVDKDKDLIKTVLVQYFIEPQQTGAQPPQAEDIVTGVL